MEKLQFVGKVLQIAPFIKPDEKFYKAMDIIDSSYLGDRKPFGRLKRNNPHFFIRRLMYKHYRATQQQENPFEFYRMIYDESKTFDKDVMKYMTDFVLKVDAKAKVEYWKAMDMNNKMA